MRRNWKKKEIFQIFKGKTFSDVTHVFSCESLGHCFCFSFFRGDRDHVWRDYFLSVAGLFFFLVLSESLHPLQLLA